MDARLAASATLYALLGVGQVATCALVTRTSQGRSTNRRLAIFLAFTVVNATASVVGILATDAVTYYNAALLNDATLYLISASYLVFLGAALPIGLTRPWRGRVGPWITFGAALTLVGTLYLFPASTLGPPVRGPLGFWTAPTRELDQLGGSASLLVFFFGLIASFRAFFAAPRGTAARRRALGYSLAFGVQDVAVLLSLAAFYVMGGDVGFAFAQFAFPLMILASDLVLVYAMLRWQLFDVDVKIKLGVKRGTVAAAFVLVFVVVAQVAQNYFAGALGWIAGGVAAGMLVFAIRPLERAAQRVADAAMPRTTGSADYVHARKHDIYRAAIEDATRDGNVSVKERQLLLRLAQNLGLSGDETVRIEGEVLGAIA